MDEEGFGVGNEMAPCKSWAQQTEESYQLQLAMALRLSSQAASADDPHFLALSSCDRHTDSAETVSHRFWVCVFSFSFAFFEFLPLFAWWVPFLFCMLGLFGCWKNEKIFIGLDTRIKFLNYVGVQDVYDASSVHWCWHMETKYLHNFEVLRQLSFDRTVFFSCSRYKGTVESCIWYSGWLKFRLAKRSCFEFRKKLPGWSSSKSFVLSMILKYLHLDSNLTEQTEAFSLCKSHLWAIWSEERYTILKHNCYWVECYIHPFMV